MKQLKKLIREKRMYFDGGFGTVLQSMGLKPETPPEQWNLTHPDKVSALHKAYIEAGSTIITTNTFGVNRNKYENYRELIASAIACAKEAVGNREDIFIAFDIGPTGKMLEPYGELPFEEAVALFSANIREAVRHGVDLILIETMGDSYETKAAVLAAKECCELPIFVTNAYGKDGKLMTGAEPLAMLSMLEGLGVDAIGMNCSFGPDMMTEMLDEFVENCSLPLIVNPNAGLPRIVNGEPVYTISPAEFAAEMVLLAKKGASVLGGCCGTTPEYIREMCNATKALPLPTIAEKERTLVSSYTHAVAVDRGPLLIGERINPTGKPKLKEALRNGNMSYILNEGIRQSEKGVQILDVNVGLPDIDETETMRTAVRALQTVTDLPLQLDSSSPETLEASMRIYNGKPLINSVNGSAESMKKIFPLVQKYGGVVIALTMDEAGIPKTATERVRIAQHIIEEAKTYGIARKNIVVDPLCMSVSSEPDSALVTLQAVRMLKELGIETCLGVSNISFGLPCREKINAAFFASAMENGLSCAIINPDAQSMLDTYHAYRLLHGQDPSCMDYIRYTEHQTDAKASVAPTTELSLQDAIVKGLKDAAIKQANELLTQVSSPTEVIDLHIIPALDAVGKSFEAKKTFLPQLLMSAECATAAFEVLKASMPQESADNRKSVILATVKGDIHDIGKNIVKVLLESHGMVVYDLGKDVPAERILQTVQETGCRVVGLSALMTTTVPSMKQTVQLLKEQVPDIHIMVGGAVLTQEDADKLGAHHYSPDAADAVKYVQSVYGASSTETICP